MKVAITEAWLVESAHEITLTLTRDDGQSVCAVVRIDRMTVWMPPVIPSRKGKGKR